MTFFIPKKKEFWLKKPVDNVELGNKYSSDQFTNAYIFNQNGPIQLHRRDIVSETGISYDYDGMHVDGVAGSNITLDAPIDVSSGEGTLIFRVKKGFPAATNISEGVFSDKIVSNISTSGLSLDIRGGDGGILLILGAGLLTCTTTNYFGDLQYHNIIVLYSVNNVSSIFIDGKEVNYTIRDISPSSITPSINNAKLGAYYSDATSWRSKISLDYLYSFNKRLSLDEAKYIQSAPYQILKPRKKYYIFGTGTGALNLLFQNSLSATNADSLAAQQHHELLAANGESASEAASLSIAQTQDLITDNSNSATFADSKAAQQTHLITTLDALSQSNADNNIIGQTHSLASVNAISTAIADVVAIALGNVINLSTAGAVSGSQADAFNLEQIQTLQPVNSLSSAQAESLAAIQTHLINFADAITISQADVLVISQGAVINLLLADSLANSQTDSIAAQQTHGLQLSGIIAETVVDNLSMLQTQQIVLSGANAQTVADSINTLAKGLGAILEPSIYSVSIKRSTKQLH